MISLNWTVEATLDQVRKGLDLGKKSRSVNPFNEFQAMMKRQSAELTEKEKSTLSKNNSTNIAAEYHQQKDLPLFDELIESFAQVRETDGNENQTVLERKNSFQKVFDDFTKKVLSL